MCRARVAVACILKLAVVSMRVPNGVCIGVVVVEKNRLFRSAGSRCHESSRLLVLRLTHKLVPITEDLPTDPEFEKTIAEYGKIIAELQKRVVGKLCEPLDVKQNTVRTADCPAGHIFADASLSNYGADRADMALINGGVIRRDRVYRAGDFTLGDLIAWSPFGNSLVIFETDGASVKKFLASQMIGSCGAGFTTQNGFYMHPAGVSWSFKCTGEGKGEVVSMEWLKHPSKSGPVQDDEVVRLMTTNYMYNDRWIGQQGLKMNKFLVNEAESVRIDAEKIDVEQTLMSSL
ncbi:hypothetical protein PINS_up016448 [Pythium insidiosum]|nr:hypothetical protein PINS_up016448 [Pythium insidiosum]